MCHVSIHVDIQEPKPSHLLPNAKNNNEPARVFPPPLSSNPSLHPLYEHVACVKYVMYVRNQTIPVAPSSPPLSLVMPNKRPQRVPAIAVLVDIHHTAPQARLQVLRVVLEQQHHHAPAQRRERRPRVVRDLAAQRLPGHAGKTRAGLDGEPREGEDDAGEDVDDDLLVDGGDVARAAGAAAEDEVAAEEAGEEGVVGA